MAERDDRALPPGRGKGSILLWGPRNSGKSTFLACLPLLPADETPGGRRWRVIPADSAASNYNADLLRQLVETGAIKPTAFTERPYRYVLQRPPGSLLGGLRRKEWDVSLLDPSGELFEQQRLRTEMGEEVLGRLSSALGLVILVDATPAGAGLTYWNMFADNIGVMVRALRERNEGARVLDAQRRITIPTAVCLTKMDLAEDHRTDPQSYLRTRLGSAYSLIDRGFTNYRVFASSALGSRAHVPDGSGRYPLPEPWGLIDPFRWLVAPDSQGLI